MHESIQAHFNELEQAVLSTSISASVQQSIDGVIRRLPNLYTKYKETNESRYGNEITTLVQAVLGWLESCPEAQALDAAFRQKLKLLHEELGVPTLMLKKAKAQTVAKKALKKK